VLIAGFKRHGLTAQITHDPSAQADLHVISGPYFAKSHWVGNPNTILLDRCYYRGNPEFVSLGWMNGQGGRDFFAGEGRGPPEIKNNATGTKLIFLADYDGPLEDADTVRFHPAQAAHPKTLLESLREHRKAIGYGTTALVTAALEGLEVTCRSEQNIMSQPNWRELLPYADWGLTEIESGEAWAHLKLSQSQR